MTARSILQAFDAYRMARMSFVQTVAELAARPQNVDILLGANVLGQYFVLVTQCNCSFMVRFLSSRTSKASCGRCVCPGAAVRCRGLGTHRPSRGSQHRPQSSQRRHLAHHSAQLRSQE